MENEFTAALVETLRRALTNPLPETIDARVTKPGYTPDCSVLVVWSGFDGHDSRAREAKARAAVAEIAPAYGRLALTLRSPSEEAFVAARTTRALLAALAALHAAASDRVALTQHVLAKRRALSQQAELRGCESEWTAEVERAAKRMLGSLREPAAYVPRAADADDASARLPGLVIDEQLLALLPEAPTAEGAAAAPAAERAELLRALAAARAEGAAARAAAQSALADCKAAGALLYHDALLLSDQAFGFASLRDALAREERSLASATDVPTLEADVALARERLSASRAARAQLAERVEHAEAVAQLRRQAAERLAASRPKTAARRLDAHEQREMAERLSSKPVAAARKARPLFLVWHGAGAPPTLRAVAARLGDERLKGRELVSLFNVSALTPLQAQRREVLVPTSCHGELKAGAVRLEHLGDERADGDGGGGDDDDDDERGVAAARGGGAGARAADALSAHDERVIARPGLPVYLTLRGLSSLAAEDALLVLVARPVDALAKRTQLAAVARRERLVAYARKTNHPSLVPAARMSSEEFAKHYAQKLRKHADALRASQKSWAAERPARRIPWRQLEASVNRLSAPAAPAGGVDFDG